ncbi:MAG TPA: GGDEF domain-containing protein, partial [Rubrivivax sp.]|nr:GGDEF domain-containing protein [Rubrivivax sp.]
PGNIPITQHIERLLAAGRDFVACQADLNHFKPFNDLYGYWRGDEMILMAARCLSAQADPQRDFLGHVGGDDFVILFQSEDWQARCRRAVADFNAAARELYDDQARAAGGVMAEDRHGVERFHPLTTLSIGAARMCGCAHKAADAANLAARAKRAAKARNVDLLVLDEAPDC